MNGITPYKYFSILSSSFIPYVDPNWNIYLSHYCAKFEYVLTFMLGLVLVLFGL